MVDRREFIKTSAAIGAGLMVAGKWESAQAFYQSPPTIQLFGTALRSVGPGGIPVAGSDGVSTWGATHYTLSIQQYQDQILPPSFNMPTTLWGYQPANPLGCAPRHTSAICPGASPKAWWAIS